MIKGIFYASRNMHSKVNNIEIVANNLANINTTGFKRELPFSEIMARYNNSLKQMTDFSQGTLLFTANPLDLAISGKGNFVVQKEGESLEFTRNGRFRISDEGFLVNEQGYKVMGKKGIIDFMDYQISKDKSITISKNGEVRIGEEIVDELKIVDFDNWSGLDRKEGLNFAAADDNYKELDEGEFEIQQGYLEESNVNPVLEMQAMIDINKDFEASQKMLNFLDVSLEKANEIGRV